VIAVFTKYDQFKINIRMQLEDQNRDPTQLDEEVKRVFDEQYLANLRGSPPFVRLQSEGFENQLACTTLIVVLQKCTSTADGVWSLLKRLLMHSPAVSLPSCF
jgi:hypothetical protein